MRKHRLPVATPVRKYPDSHQRIRSVSTSYIVTVLQDENIRVGSARLGFAPEVVGTISLHSGRDMAMHIAGVPDCMLVAIGR